MASRARQIVCSSLLYCAASFKVSLSPRILRGPLQETTLCASSLFKSPPGASFSSRLASVCPLLLSPFHILDHWNELEPARLGAN